jgi:hypothetical protein
MVGALTDHPEHQLQRQGVVAFVTQEEIDAAYAVDAARRFVEPPPSLF